MKLYRKLASMLEYNDSEIEPFSRRWLPSGSGFDSGSQIDVGRSRSDKLVLTTSFHHMNDAGYYDGWTNHEVIVKPDWDGISLRVTGKNWRDIKEYIYDCFHCALNEEV